MLSWQECPEVLVAPVEADAGSTSFRSPESVGLGEPDRTAHVFWAAVGDELGIQGPAVAESSRVRRLSCCYGNG